MANALGLDLGTSGLRALLMAEDGSVIASAAQSARATNPHPGWSEQDPGEWVTALEAAMAALAASHPEAMAQVAGIAVSGHMHGATLLDGAGEVLRPCILWNDTRSHAEAAELDAMPAFRAVSGNIVFPGFTAPKLKWVAKNEPEIFERTSKILLPAAYLNYYMTGEFVSDMSDAAGTAWLDCGGRDWSDALLEATGLSRAQMPALVEGCAVAGRLKPELADRWGIPRSAVVAGGAADNAASACGTGSLSEGEGFVSLGTSGVLLAARDGYHPEAASALHTFCHAVPGQWYQMGVMLSATDSLNWLSRITGLKPAALTGELGDLAAPGRERFLPYLAGERTPHNDAFIRGAFTGLGSDTGRADMTRAVLEGVAYGLRDSAEALRGAGAQLGPLLIIGGGSASAHWVEMIATVLDLPMMLPKAGEFGAALGAARLALVAATGGDPVALMTRPEIGRVIEPNDRLRDAFEAAYQKHRASYSAIRNIQ
ncbi:xylulokinase [Pseudooceanicola sp. CBS1P-1]|uniref:Xylulose kinase n=1 Tax=Pseudooceanicola albus TaxID=2692189 RepID=A0A6L7FW02_9RHOB|nr:MULTISPECIES: xylulokinase [Pseudooceanicola]MBT9383394.1 xylulokinase [Pseudooceanicola endophyticus]MXN16284.1 xylulokinase [Pseudooceanicola albus]